MKQTIFQEQSDAPKYYAESWSSGGIWYSYERGVKIGDVREINGVLSKAWQIYPRIFLKSKIVWINLKPESLRDVGINERP